ncbi:MAG: MlaD family protein [Candidatus Manganitrophus sp. SA1]|nr:MlaD family protein [Candidatus Manganitrophus morganii]
MEAKVNYARVGLFVILLGAALVVLLIWLGRRESRRVYDHYDVYVRESVTGLNIGASVKYLGVDIGYLKEMVVDPENYQRLRLTLSVSEETPVTEETVAYLEFQGLTGVAVVNLAGGRRGSPLLTAKPGERYPVIKNVPSFYARFEQGLSRLLTDPSLPRLVDHLDNLALRTQSLVDEENRAAFKQMLVETAKIAGTLDQMTERVDAQLPTLLDHFQESSRALREMSDKAAQTSAMLERLVNQNQARIEEFTGQTLAEAGLLITELRELTATSKRLAAQLEREPNALIFGKSQRPRGPGE